MVKVEYNAVEMNDSGQLEDERTNVLLDVENVGIQFGYGAERAREDFIVTEALKEKIGGALAEKGIYDSTPHEGSSEAEAFDHLYGERDQASLSERHLLRGWRLYDTQQGILVSFDDNTELGLSQILSPRAVANCTWRGRPGTTTEAGLATAANMVLQIGAFKDPRKTQTELPYSDFAELGAMITPGGRLRGNNPSQESYLYVIEDANDRAERWPELERSLRPSLPMLNAETLARHAPGIDVAQVSRAFEIADYLDGKKVAWAREAREAVA